MLDTLKTRLFLLLIISQALSCTVEVKKNETQDSSNSKELSTNQQVRAPNTYINGISYLKETNEFYVSLPFKDEHQDIPFDSLASKADSTIYEDDETSRENLPLAVAKEYLDFDLRLIGSVKIYDHKHRFVCFAKFVRTKFYSPTIESSFIAVFKPDSPVRTAAEQKYYCISSQTELLKPTSEPIAHNALSDRIHKELNLKADQLWATKHLKTGVSGATLSILSANVEGEKQPVSFITELEDNKLTVLGKQSDDFAFWDILVMLVEHNKKPVLLITMAIPETDVSPIYVPYVWDGSKYKMERNAFYAEK